MNRTSLWGVVACLGALSLGCSDALEPPVPGVATLMLASAHGDDGAMLITLEGPGIGELEPASTNHVLYQRRISTDEVRVLIVGNLADGALLQAALSDVRDLGSYGATLAQVASRADQLREDLSGYSLTLAVAGR